MVAEVSFNEHLVPRSPEPSLQRSLLRSHQHWVCSEAGRTLRAAHRLEMENIIGAGFLGGIGFTMSIFIALLAFDDDAIINNSNIAIIIASLIAGIIGFLWLKLTLKTKVETDEPL